VDPLPVSVQTGGGGGFIDFLALLGDDLVWVNNLGNGSADIGVMNLDGSAPQLVWTEHEPILDAVASGRIVIYAEPDRVGSIEVPADGGRPIGDAATLSNQSAGSPIVVGGGFLFTLIGTNVMRFPLDGGSGSAFVSSQNGVTAISSDNAAVYWSTSDDPDASASGALWRSAFDEANPTRIATGLPGSAAALIAGSYAYIFDVAGRRVLRIRAEDVRDQVPELLSETPWSVGKLTGIAAAENFLYWSTDDRQSGAFAIWRAPICGGPAELLHENVDADKINFPAHHAASLQIVGPYLLYGTGNDSVMRIPR
jgi:hypothetical protein